MKQKLYTQPTIILLLNLVITDLILLVCHLPFVISAGFSGGFIIGETDAVRCKFCDVGVLSHIFTLNSVYTITLMSFDRFLFIYKPLRYQQYITPWRIVLAIVLTWILTAVVGLLPAMGYGDIIFYRPLFSCFVAFSLSESYYYIILLSVAILPLIPLVNFNLWVCVVVQKNIRIVYSTRRLANPGDLSNGAVFKSMRKRRHKKELNLIRVFGVLFVTNFLTWLPVTTFAILLVSDVNVPSGVGAAVNIFFMSQVLLHPLVETCLIQEVRNPLHSVLKCCCGQMRDKLASENSSKIEQSRRRSDAPVYSRCGCLEVCSVAVMLHHHSTSTEEDTSHEMT